VRRWNSQRPRRSQCRNQPSRNGTLGAPAPTTFSKCWDHKPIQAFARAGVAESTGHPLAAIAPVTSGPGPVCAATPTTRQHRPALFAARPAHAPPPVLYRLRIDPFRAYWNCQWFMYTHRCDRLRTERQHAPIWTNHDPDEISYALNAPHSDRTRRSPPVLVPVRYAPRTAVAAAHHTACPTSRWAPCVPGQQ